MDTALTVASDVIIAFTFPLHCRYLYVMLRRDAKISTLEYAFRATLTNLVTANILYSLVFILVQEPAVYGIFADFYRKNSWWLGKLFIMQSIPLILLTALFHLLIAINRISALVNPTGHQQFWSERRVRRILIVFWILSLIECIPLIYPIEGSYCDRVAPTRSVGVALVIVGELPNFLYQGIAIGVGGLLEIITLIMYMFVGMRIGKLKILSQSTISTTVSAVLISTGGFLIIIVIFPDLLVARLTGEALWSPEMFYAVFKFANAYNNAVAPWVMLFQYRNIRRLLIGKINENSVSRRVTSKADPRQNRSL